MGILSAMIICQHNNRPEIMTNRRIEIRKVVVPVESVRGLSEEQRFAYYLLGHIFNEIMTLQKVVGFAIPKNDDRRALRRNAEISQMFFMFRLSSSKIYEAQQVLNGKEMKLSLEELVFPAAPECRTMLKELNQAIGQATWLTRMRNGLGFHFPNFQKWKDYITPDESWVDDVIYLGRESGNTFYDGSASVAAHWMFDKYRDLAIKDAFVPLVDEMIMLLKMINNFVEQALGVMIDGMLPEEAEAEYAGRILGPEHDRVSLPFWTYLSHMRKK